MPVLQILFNLPAFILGFSAKLVFLHRRDTEKNIWQESRMVFHLPAEKNKQSEKNPFLSGSASARTYLVIEWELFINVFRRFLERA